MTREQKHFKMLNNQAQGMFWQYAASAKQLASRITISAYKLSFLEFLEYACDNHNLMKVGQIRKRHVDCYIDYLRHLGGDPFLVYKRVYAICFWLGMIKSQPERFPAFSSFDLKYSPQKMQTA